MKRDRYRLSDLSDKGHGLHILDGQNSSRRVAWAEDTAMAMKICDFLNEKELAG